MINNINFQHQINPRNRISDQIPDHPFTDYWDIFVLKHQHPVNIILHIMGIIFFYGLLFFTWQLQNFWLLLTLPVTQLIGILGHIVFEPSHIDKQDAILTWRASYCLGKMLLRVLMGKYQDDIKERLEILNNYLSKNHANI